MTESWESSKLSDEYLPEGKYFALEAVSYEFYLYFEKNLYMCFQMKLLINAILFFLKNWRLISPMAIIWILITIKVFSKN